jgi:hypothetical protein
MPIAKIVRDIKRVFRMLVSRLRRSTFRDDLAFESLVPFM